MRGNKKGATLIEVVIGVALMGLIATGFFMALNTSIKATGMVDERTTAESLTRSELEYIKNQPYIYWQYVDGTSTPPDYGDPNGRIPEDFRDHYTMTLSAQPIDPETHQLLTMPLDSDQGMQLITVEVYYQSEPLLTTEAYKVQR